MTRPSSIIRPIILVQAVLLGAYGIVEWVRNDTAATAILSTKAPVRVQGSLPRLQIRKPNGTPVDLHSLQKPALIHFWATWCPVCRVELPGLLRAAKQLSVDVWAIALDRKWTEVERFFDRQPHSSVALGNAGEIETKLGVRALPVTYLVEPGGRLRLLFDGACDWTNTEFQRTWIKR